MALERKIRILLCKLGLDGHDRGVKVLTRMLMEAGMEVIYTGRHQTAELVVSAAIQEDVDVIGLSFSCSEHMFYSSKIMNLLKERAPDRFPVLVGGAIPVRDVPKLKQMGISEVFRADTPIEEITRYIMGQVKEKSSQI